MVNYPTPIPSLQSLEPKRTIYVGTFSKTFSPTIRLGYMVIPDELVSVVAKAKYGTDIHSPLFEQLTMAQLIREGSYTKHIYKMSKIYALRRRLIVSSLKKMFKDKVHISGDHSGLHLVVTIKCLHLQEEIIQNRLFNNDVEIWDIDRFYLYKTENKGAEEYKTFVLGYGNCREDDIVKGLFRLKSALL